MVKSIKLGSELGHFIGRGWDEFVDRPTSKQLGFILLYCNNGLEEKEKGVDCLASKPAQNKNRHPLLGPQIHGLRTPCGCVWETLYGVWPGLTDLKLFMSYLDFLL